MRCDRMSQQASLRALRDAVAQAGELLKMDCPTYRPITPVVRIETMEQRLDTMLRAINIVQLALQKFYGSLTDEQKERFNSRRRRDNSVSPTRDEGVSQAGGDNFCSFVVA